MLNSNSPTFKEDITALAKELKATTLIECIGGSITGTLLECLPARTTLVFYGALSEKGPCEIDPLLLIGRSYVIKGFILGDYLASKGMKIVSLIGKCQKLMSDKSL